ncbi:MAG: metalloregulator ArsR/SmtB family transcription factor [Gemmatimonadetes bacterium]|nr:metalloregulator ArsR/SmtB family transcription factor [Gemmatimonadota bacterium]
MQLAAAKRALVQQFARIGKAVASPARLELLDLLAQGEKTVATLSRQANLTVKNASAHLRELRSASLVATRRSGPYVYYRLADPEVHTFLRSLQELAHKRLAEARQLIRDYFEAPQVLEPVRLEELLARLRGGEVTVLDVRPEEEYGAGHIPGALSIPLGQLERRLGELPPDRDVVAYCRGPYCVLALEAVEILRAGGLHARRLAEGLPDWRRRGYTVAAGARAQG